MIKVNLTKKVEGGRYCPVVVSENGRIKPDWVTINGVAEHHKEGSYYIDWTEEGKRRRQMVGKGAATALARKLRKQAELEAKARGVQVVEEGTETRRRIDEMVALYLQEIKDGKKHKTWLAYSKALVYFLENVSKVFLEDIERTDMMRFATFLRDKKGLSPRSVSNKFENVLYFLKSQGVDNGLRKGDRPVYVLTEPEAYDKEELDEFFAVCIPSEKLLFQFFLMTGMREQEVLYTMQRNVSTKHNTISMTWKPEFKWYPKGYKEREIPVPTSLVQDLVAARPGRWEGRNLLFHTNTGKPMRHMLETCKIIAERAGLDPENWWLHKFRATFATWHLQNGVDLKTVQNWMGHVDLESTMRYLKPARNEQVRDRVNSTFG